MLRAATALALSLALGACSAFGLGGDAEVGLMIVLPSAEAQALDFEATVGGRTFTRADFQDINARQFNADNIATTARPTSVSCTVSRGGTRSTGAVRLDLEDGWRYGVQCAVQRTNPIDACFGCRGSEAFALDTALGLPPGDSLFVVWGGDPIDSPPVY